MTRMFMALLIATIVSLIVGCSQPRRDDHARDFNRELARIESQRLAAISRDDAGAPPVQRFTQNIFATTATLSLHDGSDSSAEELHLALFFDDAPASNRSDTSDSSGHTDHKTDHDRPLPGLFDTIYRDLRHAPRSLWTDTKRVYGKPLNLAILGVTYGASLTLQEAGPDDTVEHHYARHHTFDKGWRNAFDVLGNPGTHFALAGLWYLAGQQTHDDKTYQVGKTLGSALLINGITCTLSQAATADRAPNGRYGTFYSGHTSSSFVIASVMHEAYGPVVGIPLYGLATMVGIQRLDAREHYMSDVVMGAVVGIVIGHTVAGGHEPEIFGWKIIPYADPNRGSTGLALAKELP